MHTPNGYVVYTSSFLPTSSVSLADVPRCGLFYHPFRYEIHSGPMRQSPNQCRRFQKKVTALVTQYSRGLAVLRTKPHAAIIRVRFCMLKTILPNLQRYARKRLADTGAYVVLTT